MLVENPRITFVDITECNITELGATAVGEALPSLKGLKKLRLGGNAIGTFPILVKLPRTLTPG